MTYFRYAERDVDSQINWAEVGKNMTDMLDEKVRLRQEKRDLLDEASRNYAQQLTDAPMGDSTHINNFTLDAANDMREYHLMLDNLLKSGKMDPREYLKSIQNMQTDTTNLFNLSKEYSAGYAETMERMKNEESQKLEQSLRASLDGYSKLGNHKAYINPTDGSLSIGQMIEGPDGVMQMGKPVTIAELRNRLTEKYNRYDVNGSVSKAVKSIPSKTKIREISNKYGSTIFEEEDFTKFPEFKEWFEDTKNGLTVVDTNLTSILTENVVMASNGQEYSFVQKQGDVFVDVETGEVVKKKEANHIETSINRNSGKREFNFTEEQITAAKDYVGTQIISQLKDEQTFKRTVEPPRPTATDEQRIAGQKKTDEDVSMMSDLYYGDANKVRVAEQYFRDSIPNAVSVKKQENSILVSFKDGTKRIVQFGESFDDFAKSGGPLMLGNINITEAIERAGGKRFKTVDGKQVELEQSKVLGEGSSQIQPEIERSNISSVINDKGDTISSMIKSTDIKDDLAGRVVDTTLNKLAGEIESAISARATYLNQPDLAIGLVVKKNSEGDGLVAELDGKQISSQYLDEAFIGDAGREDLIKQFINDVLQKVLNIDTRPQDETTEEQSEPVTTETQSEPATTQNNSFG